jgi:hypothetical protein
MIITALNEYSNILSWEYVIWEGKGKYTAQSLCSKMSEVGCINMN